MAFMPWRSSETPFENVPERVRLGVLDVGNHPPRQKQLYCVLVGVRYSLVIWTDLTRSSLLYGGCARYFAP